MIWPLYPRGTNPLTSIDSETGWTPETGLSLRQKKLPLPCQHRTPIYRSAVISPQLFCYREGHAFYNVRGSGEGWFEVRGCKKCRRVSE